MNAYKFCMTDNIKKDIKTFRNPLTELKKYSSDEAAIAKAKTEGVDWDMEWCVFETSLDFSKDKLIFWDKDSRLAVFACPTSFREEVIKIISGWCANNHEAFECAGFWVESTEDDMNDSNIRVMYRDPKTDEEKDLGFLSDFEEILEKNFTDEQLYEIVIEKCRNYVE